jgi:hypothetical protein
MTEGARPIAPASDVDQFSDATDVVASVRLPKRLLARTRRRLGKAADPPPRGATV